MKKIGKTESIEQNCQDFLREILRVDDILSLSQEDKDNIVRNIEEHLPGREAKVLIGWFGLIEPGKRTQNNLGKEQGCGCTRISQLKIKAVRKMRHPRRMRFLRRYSLAMLRDGYEELDQQNKKLQRRVDWFEKMFADAAGEENLKLHGETSIEADGLYWSVRAYNFLKNAELLTLGDITRQSEKELLQKTHGIGRRTINEIKETLARHGLKLRSDVAE
ncbi:MAG: DNA-directed RNA polymerase subunit alpha C-terminal domain-containing protein [Parcubacteria group bacterium]|jgi:hypothetical protein